MREKIWLTRSREAAKDMAWVKGESPAGRRLAAGSRFWKRPSRQLFVGVGLVGFFFSPSLQKAPLNLQAARVLAIWPQMVSHMKTTANGVFELPARGKKFRSIGR